MKELLRCNNFYILSIGAVPAALIRWQIDQIFIANIIGCFLLGFINSLALSRRYKLIFGFGFCGSLTTFSGWSSQLFHLINQRFYKRNRKKKVEKLYSTPPRNARDRAASSPFYSAVFHSSKKKNVKQSPKLDFL